MVAPAARKAAVRVRLKLCSGSNIEASASNFRQLSASTSSSERLTIRPSRPAPNRGREPDDSSTSELWSPLPDAEDSVDISFHRIAGEHPFSCSCTHLRCDVGVIEDILDLRS